MNLEKTIRRSHIIKHYLCSNMNLIAIVLFFPISLFGAVSECWVHVNFEVRDVARA